MLGDIVLGILIILLMCWMMYCYACLLNNESPLKIKMCILVIIFILLGGTFYLNVNTTIEELTVYQNGNIEVIGKNGFGDVKTERYSFSEYKVKKGNNNSCFMYDGAEVKLTPKYYEQYKGIIKTEKSMNIKINE